MFLADNKKRYEHGLRKYDIPKLRPTNALITTREQADRYTHDSNKECYCILCSAFDGDTPYKIGEATETEETEENIAAAATVTPMITVETPATTATNVENRQVAAHTTVTIPPVPTTVTAPTMPSIVTAPPVTAVAAVPNLRALTIGTANNGAESFHLQAPPPTTATNAPACPGVTFGATPNISDINTRMMEIANNGPPVTATMNHPDRQRQWSFNRGFMETRSCYGCGEQGHLAKKCPTRPYCSHCKTNTHITQSNVGPNQHRLGTRLNHLASTPSESPGAGGYHPVQ